MTKLPLGDGDAPAQKPPLPQQIILSEAKARFDAAGNAQIDLVERLVWFWSNHFCVSADKDVAMVGAHVLGRFADLLQAVESHPTMLLYLDNVQSMGADSIAGINRDKGLNENLARETAMATCNKWREHWSRRRTPKPRPGKNSNRRRSGLRASFVSPTSKKKFQLAAL